MYEATVYTLENTYYVKGVSPSLRDKAIDRIAEDEEILDIELN